MNRAASCYRGIHPGNKSLTARNTRAIRQLEPNRTSRARMAYRGDES